MLNGKRKWIGSLLISGLSMLIVMPAANRAYAVPITYNFSGSGTVGGETASATASFVVNGDSIVLTLVNGVDGPNSVKSALVGISFNVGSGTSLTGLDGSARLITIASGGGFIDIGGSSAVDPTSNWLADGSALQGNTDTFAISVLGSGNPNESLLGFGPYPNGSIGGNGPHNPFAQKTLTLDFTITGLNSGGITGTNFYFNTDGTQVTGGGGCVGDCTTTSVPEPGTLTLLGSGLLCMVGFLRQRSSK